MSHLLLFPGAGAGRDQSTLVALERGLRPAWTTVRADFDYRKEGRRAPDRPPKLLAAVRERARRHRRRARRRRRSLDGRADVLDGRRAADGEPPPAKLAGVVAISYPLHPPGKPREPPRRAPAGDHRAVPVRPWHADPFGTPDELRASGRRRSPDR